jgi:hypothetical protein
MPATVLPFVRAVVDRPAPAPEPASPPDPPQLPELRPQALPTPRQIAHRRAMLSHLTQHTSTME